MKAIVALLGLLCLSTAYGTNENPTPAELHHDPAVQQVPMEDAKDEVEYFVHFAIYSGKTMCQEADMTFVSNRILQSYDLPGLKEHILSQFALGERECANPKVTIRFVTRVPIL